ncbi:MAG: hypothetical protein M4579_000888 [Chaenotheca gracillima]|nr:MAG: hypothetical protein M4579_000888 [Chaenotheca gracillima]
MASATASAIPASDHGPTAAGDSGECSLLGPFSLLVQGALGLLALLSLVWKRYRERPQRPIKIWAFDASKQVVGSVLVHIANLLMSMLSAGQFSVSAAVSSEGDSPSHESYQPNPCSFYLLNLAIDTTIGIPILVVLLKVLTYAFSLTPVGKPRESIKSGNYGNPPKASWWMKQSLIYFLGLLGMKICVLFIFTVLPWISRIGDWALKWTEGDKTKQVIFVMLLFPLIMNALQYYIIDSFIKEQNPEGHQPVPDHDEDDETDDGQERQRGRTSIDSLSDESSRGDSVDGGIKKDRSRTRYREAGKSLENGLSQPNLEEASKNPDEYNPQTDGEDSRDKAAPGN